MMLLQQPTLRPSSPVAACSRSSRGPRRPPRGRVALQRRNLHRPLRNLLREGRSPSPFFIGVVCCCYIWGEQQTSLTCHMRQPRVLMSRRQVNQLDMGEATQSNILAELPSILWQITWLSGGTSVCPCAPSASPCSNTGLPWAPSALLLVLRVPKEPERTFSSIIID